MDNHSAHEFSGLLLRIDDFILFLQSNNYSPQTVYNYRQDLKIFDNFLIDSNIKLSQMDPRNILEFKAYLSSPHRHTASQKQEADLRLSPASVNRCLSSVRGYIRFLIDQGEKMPVAPDQFKLIKREKTLPNVAEFEDFIRLIESPSSLESDPIIASRNRSMLEVLFSTGMRVSELVSLNRRDLNQKGRILIMGKGRKQRLVYLTPRAQFYLEQYLVLRNDVQQALFVPIKGKTLTKSQRRITTRYVQDRLKKYREILKINLPTTPHSLRHGFATYLAEEGASPVAIQLLLGHESLNTTTRYVNASDRFAEESHKKFHPLTQTDE